MSYKTELKKVQIYNDYPLLTPFIGEEYGKKHSRCLFIGESHYLPKESKVVSDAEWYNKTQKDHEIDEASAAYLNTSNIIQEDVINKNYGSKAHAMYRNYGNSFAHAMNIEGGFQKALPHTAFYNYFLRPAETTGDSINILGWDEEVRSFENLKTLYNILKPEKIVFLSSKAKQSFHRVRWSNEEGAKEFGELVDKIVIAVPHPCSAWWNKTSKKLNGLNGRQHLEKELLELNNK